MDEEVRRLLKPTRAGEVKRQFDRGLAACESKPVAYAPAASRNVNERILMDG
jgi:hypothetical protein